MNLKQFLFRLKLLLPKEKKKYLLAAASTEQIQTIRKSSYDQFFKTLQKKARVSYLSSGSFQAQRVIFIHGCPGSAKVWADFLLDTPKELEYIAIDRIGYGDSYKSMALTSFEEQAHAIEPLLNEKPTQKKIIVGHSLGGALATLACLKFPGKIQGIIICGGALDPDLEKIFLIQKVGKALSFLLPQEITNANQELLKYKTELRKFVSRLPEIKHQITIIHGTADSEVPYENVDFMQSKFVSSKHLKIVKLQDQRHYLPRLETALLQEEIIKLSQQTKK